MTHQDIVSAIVEEELDTIKLLVTQANVEAEVTDSGLTPLMLAVTHGTNDEMVEFLVSIGANPDRTNRYGISARTLANLDGYDYF